MFRSITQKNRGQVMLVTVLVLGGAIISASIIAGFLTTRNIRTSTLAEDSAKAIFAADAGLERLLFECLRLDNCAGNQGQFSNNSQPFSNEAYFIASYARDPVTGLFTELRAVGYSSARPDNVARALAIRFQ